MNEKLIRNYDFFSGFKKIIIENNTIKKKLDYVRHKYNVSCK